MIANPTPRYYKIYRLLKQAIENREVDNNEPLPGENALAEKYQVSRLTIRRSLDLLQQEGLVERRQGSGTYPRLDKVKVRPLPADIKKLLAHMDSMGAHTKAVLLSLDYEKPPADVQTQLELPANARVQKATRVRYHDNAPFSHLITYVPEHIGKRYTEQDLARQPIQTIFKNLGINMASAEQSFSATLADEHHARALNIDAGAPLLCIKRVVRDTANTPVEYLVATYNPQRFEYRMALSNKRSKGSDIWVVDDGR